MDDLKINDNVTIPGWELWFTASKSGGPGGQHANKTSSRVTLSWNLMGSSVFTESQKGYLARRLGSHLNQDGVLSISVDDERSQHRNRARAEERLAALIRSGLQRPKRRRPTKPSQGAKRRRLQSKRERSEVKKLRGKPRLTD